MRSPRQKEGGSVRASPEAEPLLLCFFYGSDSGHLAAMEWRAVASLALEIWMDAAANGRAGRLALQIATRYYMPDLLTITRLRRTCRYVRELWTQRLSELSVSLHDEDD